VKQVRLLDLGDVHPLRSQTIYHALAHAMTDDTPDTIVLVSPSHPYVCIGYHQDLDKEIDHAYCQTCGLPVFRREVGGGSVYLDNGQVFTQWIFHREHLSINLEQLFEFYVRPLVDTYRTLGISAYFRPINDVHVDGKKIGGSGAAQISMVLVGSLMFDFDKAAMVRVLKVPSEKMRDKIYESLEQYMTSMSEELGQMPDRQAVKNLYIQSCAEVLNADILPGTMTPEEEAIALHLEKQFTSKEWLFQKGGLRQTGVKIHQDVRVVEGAYKAPGGLIRVVARLKEGRIDDLTISGDFTLLPAFAIASIEQAVLGSRPEQAPLLRRLIEVFQTLGIQSPGITPEHFAEAILIAITG
jgi:lipoate-protein ligase A